VPGVTVTTSANLAGEVTGSLASVSSLADNLGKWLAIAVLAAAFLLASLLTMAAVSRRVREFGTLKALGWRSRRIIGQVLGESVTTGIIAGIAGVALGFAGAAIASAVAPSLTAAVGPTTGSATPGGARSFNGFPGGGGFSPPAGGFARAAANATRSVAVHLTASVTVGAVVLAVVLALAGGLIAGGFGGWRAARLRPATALARVQTLTAVQRAFPSTANPITPPSRAPTAARRARAACPSCRRSATRWTRQAVRSDSARSCS
jgi:ABC-type antimicrobial peptide transport system permease subunit